MGWFFSQGISANEIHISCGLAQYKIKHGIINSEVFFIDGPKLLIRGKEQINLANETINSIYHLQKKNILNHAMLPAVFDTDVPIKVSGHLANPTVEQAPLDSIESKANRYIFAPVATVPREVLGAVLDIFEDNREAQSPCNKYLQN